MTIRSQELPNVLLNSIKYQAWVCIGKDYFLTLVRENRTLRILLGPWNGYHNSFLALYLGTCIY